MTGAPEAPPSIKPRCHPAALPTGGKPRPSMHRRQRWRRLYWLVAGLLAAEVIACWLLTRWAS